MPSRLETLSRRRFGAGLFTTAAGAGAGALMAGGAAREALAAPPAGGVLAVPPVARLEIGKFTVYVLSDGFIDLPYGAFTGVDATVLEEEAKGAYLHREGGIRASFTQWLVDDGERLVLIDSGAAGTLSPTSGRLPQALAAVGVTPENIDAVILTHLHADHLSGLIAGDQRVFPNAIVHVDRRDIAHFTDPAKAAAAPDFLKSSFAGAGRLVELYQDLEQLDGGEHELVSGLSTFGLEGHTPGHVGVRVADGDKAVAVTGDLLFTPAIHPERVDVGLVFEQDAAAAQAMRQGFFPKAEAEGLLIAATHMPFPGLGRIVRDGNGRAWLPAEWEYAG